MTTTNQMMTTNQITTTMTKLLHINRLYLPVDILEYIKPYLFYDVKTYEIIQNIKIQKQIINILINEALSRKNSLYYSPYPIGFPDFVEDWVFGFPGDHVTERLQMQATNCYDCGNYKDDPNMIYHRHIPFPNKIYCKCPIEEYIEHEYYEEEEYDP